MEYMLAYGDMRELTEEELAGAVRLDPSQIAGLGPSLEALMEMLRERKRKILATYETARVKAEAARQFHQLGRPDAAAGAAGASASAGRRGRATLRPRAAVVSRGTSAARFARQLVQLLDRLGNKYQVDELAAKYEFTGRRAMTIPQGPGDQGGAGRDRPAAEAIGRGGQDGADRRDRPGGAGRVRRAGRHRAPQPTGRADPSSTSATWPRGRGWSGRPADTA